MYFTVLERFTKQELLDQMSSLSQLEKELLSDTKAKSRRRTLRNQKYRIEARLRDLELEVPDIPSELHVSQICTNTCTDTAYIDLQANGDSLDVAELKVSREVEGRGDYPSLSNTTTASVPPETIISTPLACSESMECRHIRQDEDSGKEETIPTPQIPSTSSSLQAGHY